jgi:hypothetical protein
MNRMTERVRWRVTLDQLCHLCDANPYTLEYWAALGALGPRWKEPRNSGKWRHITREAADRAVLMSRIVKAGVEPWRAAQIASTHQHGDTTPLTVTIGEVQIQVSREELP